MNNLEVIARGGGNYSTRRYFEEMERKRDESLRNDLAQESDSSNQNELNQSAEVPVVFCQCSRNSEHGSARQ